MEFTGCSLKEAIQMASTTPARLMGLDHLGDIAEGKRADLISEGSRLVSGGSG